MSDRLIVAVDFDGTVVEHEFPRVGRVLTEAFHALRGLVALDVGIVLFTMRSGDFLREPVRLFAENKVPLLGLNVNPSQSSWTSSPKAYAHVYVDDAAFGCPLVKEPGKRPYADWGIIGPSLLDMARDFKKGTW